VAAAASRVVAAVVVAAVVVAAEVPMAADVGEPGVVVRIRVIGSF
jgi:hypothetical protein